MAVDWLIVLIQVPVEPTRHRVAVWRELRKLGAVPVPGGAWCVPAVPLFAAGLERAEELCRRGGGTLAVFKAVPHNTGALEALEAAFRAVRLDEWREFEADCDKFEAEIAREIVKEKFTFGELEEEEQSLDRLRRWHRDLKRRDVLRLPEADAAERHLERCAESLAGFADRIYAILRVPTDDA